MKCQNPACRQRDRQLHMLSERLRRTLAALDGLRRSPVLTEATRARMLESLREGSFSLPDALAGRTRPEVIERRLAFAHLRRRGFRVTAIGQLFGRHHTTILHALKRPVRAAA